MYQSEINLWVVNAWVRITMYYYQLVLPVFYAWTCKKPTLCLLISELQQQWENDNKWHYSFCITRNCQKMQIFNFVLLLPQYFILYFSSHLSVNWSKISPSPLIPINQTSVSSQWLKICLFVFLGSRVRIALLFYLIWRTKWDLVYTLHPWWFCYA